MGTPEHDDDLKLGDLALLLLWIATVIWLAVQLAGPHILAS